MNPFIILLFSLFGSLRADFSYDSSEENNEIFSELANHVHDMKKAVTSTQYEYDNHDYKEHADYESEDEKATSESFTNIYIPEKTSSSPSSPSSTTTLMRTTLPTCTNEKTIFIDKTTNVVRTSTFFQVYIKTSSLREFEEAIVESNDNRLYLKIFTYVLITCLICLSVIFSTLYIIRKRQRYRQYCAAANGSPNPQLTLLNDIYG